MALEVKEDTKVILDKKLDINSNKLTFLSNKNETTKEHFVWRYTSKSTREWDCESTNDFICDMV